MTELTLHFWRGLLGSHGSPSVISISSALDDRSELRWISEEEVTGVGSSDSVRQEDEEVGQEDEELEDDVGMVVLSDVTEDSGEDVT